MNSLEFGTTKPGAALTKATVSLAFLRRRALILVVAFLMAGMSAGIVPNALAASFLEHAQTYYDQGELNGASIELKNALQVNPNDAEARFLLGKVHFKLGDTISAEKEFLRARDLGYASAELDLLLAYARLGQGKFNAVLSEIGKSDAIESDVQRDLQVARGEALFGLGKFDEAEAVFDRVLRERPHVRAVVDKARIAMALGDTQTARSLLDRATKINSHDPTFVVVDAAWYFHEQRYEEAKARFALAVQLDPTKLESRVGQIQSLLAMGDLDEAALEIDKLEGVGSELPVIRLQEAIVQFLRHRYQEAETAAAGVLAVAKSQPQALLVAGLSDYQLARYEQARIYLGAYLEQSPQDYQARMALGATILRLGNPKDAYGTLTELENREVPNDSGYLAVLSTAAFGMGDKEAGLKYLEQVAVKEADNAEILEKLGVARQSQGDDAGAAVALERALALAPDRLSVYMNLVAVYLHQKQLDKAIEIARRAQFQIPGGAAGDTLLGIVCLAKGEFEQAREAFQRALEKEPGNAEAAGNLANILVIEGNVPDARKILDEVLKAKPGHLRTLMTSAELAARSGDNATAEALLRQAIEFNPSAMLPRILLGRYLVKADRAAEALALTEPALAKVPENLGLLEVVGQARMRMGDSIGALEALRTLAMQVPDSVPVLNLLMQALDLNGHIAEALDAAEHTLTLDPNNLPARLGQVRCLAQLGRLDEARAKLRPLKEEFPDQDEIFLLEGRLALVEKRGADAVAAYRKALDIRRKNWTLIELTRALFAIGKGDEAIRTMEAWLEVDPQDVLTRSALAEAQIAMGQTAEAGRQYEAILGIAPNNARALNNLAWIQMTLGEADEAIALARRALTLAPHSPSVADTLAVVLLEVGQRQEAFHLLQSARAAAADDTSIQFHFARALAANGQIADAVAELRMLLTKNNAFPERPQAAALLAELAK